MKGGWQPEWELFEIVLDDDDYFSFESEFEEPEAVEYWSWYCPGCGYNDIADTYATPPRRTECPRCGRQF